MSETLEEQKDEVLDLDSEDSEDVEAAMRDAMEAVEAIESRSTSDEPEDGEEEIPSNDVADRVLSREETLERDLREAQERALRSLADFENLRRRSERERSEYHKYAGETVLREVLTVVDNLERALEAGGGVEDLKSGVEMIQRQLVDLLGRFGVEPVESEGAVFDPSVHEAVSKIEDENVDQPRVADVYRRGYRLHDRLLRAAMVRVSTPPLNDEPGDESSN